MGQSAAPMQGKVSVVTGATSGIGAATALGLAQLGSDVVLIGRDRTRGERVLREVQRVAPGATATFLAADFRLQQSVRDVASDVLARCDRLDVLINNAGIIATQRRLTVDGIEEQFAVNHLAPFLLTNLLLDRMKESAPARIINVSSDMHSGRCIDFDDLNRDKAYKPYRVYGETKLANVLFTYELARRLEGTGVTANCLHPGVVRTAIVRDMILPVRLLMRIFGFLLKSPANGAKTSIFLASDAALEAVSAKFFMRCAEHASSPESYDGEAARRLWEISAKMTGLAT
ncbi:MAG: retinol dehydrogenase [Candidatus Hydrogenedentota bacterium]